MQRQYPGSEPGRPPAKKRRGEPSDRDETDDDDERRGSSAIRGLLRDFLEQQLRLDLRRQEMMERHARERLFFEDQWRQEMQRMERERLVLEQQWMEREERRRARADRSDALLTDLLTRLLQGDL